MAATDSAQQLREAILERFDELSPRLQQIGRYILDDPNSAGVETLAVISDRTGAPPSAIVRFAQTFGFNGAASMQRLLKDQLLAARPESGYHRRAREFLEGAEDTPLPGPVDLLAEFAGASALALEHLLQSVDHDRFEECVAMLREAETVHVAGFRRSFPVAAYLAYSLQRGGKRAILVDGIGGMAGLQANRIGKGDLLVGISFSPYADEMVSLAEHVAQAGTPIAIITDSPVGPVAKPANCLLQVRDTEVRGFRTLSGSMCLVQALAISYAFELTKISA
ncbi:transcriptional regulator, RpiR family [Novosphingobium sp. CF614]|uniref:MurR/RpiR family transcriptional regulator n=1 Tax=Novosphingobium sp. CF614 TaxID=1884364 RepID=UPI0008E6D051|nr:MurR/RpiR family transcriptional regulator [Novosphingobium sp. CF614]SFG08042.1 transcriptional regulator, RpiR family [Novosphingobium sp. CF614]